MKINKENENKVMHLISEYYEYNKNNGKLYHKKARRGATVGKEAGYLKKNGYITIRLNNKDYMAHRIIWYFYYGKWPTHQLDHINGNRSDNRICNLREASHRINMQNLPLHRKGRLPGVTIDKRRPNSFVARIYVNNKRIYLGSFKTEYEANQQYIKACKLLY